MDLFFDEKMPTIPEFFKNKDIFVTGGSGFIGKVLIEKLLRSCPDIGNIYVLLREKKGKSPQERVKDLTNVPLFDLLRKLNGAAINKVIPINGNICELRLGLSDEDRNTIIDKVSVVFNVAASVRFADPLKKAILNNVRSTVEVINLVKELNNLAAFTHVSTAYCNADKEIIEEKLYPAHVNWRHAIRLAEEMDEHALEIFKQKYIKPLPNTYTFTKSLAEHVVNDLCEGEIPAIIVRPTVVLATISDPMPAWIDGFNGPFTYLIGMGAGLIRIVYVGENVVTDYVFVDNVVKSIIIAAWEKHVNREKHTGISIYNSSSDYPTAYKPIMSVIVNVLKEVPMDYKVWAPVKIEITNCYHYYFINVILRHMIPAMLLDVILKLSGKTPIFCGLQRRVYLENMVHYYFGSRSWIFKTENYLGLAGKLLQDDLEAFSFRLPTELNAYEKLYNIVKKLHLANKVHLLQESPVVSRKTRVIDKGLRIVDGTLRLAVLGFILYTVFWKYDIVTCLSQNIYNYFSNL